MRQKYFGSWSDYAGLVESFFPDYFHEVKPISLATDDEIVFASYGGGAYEGDALVLYERNGQLYEVSGSHCSCYGLEGQWEPEATSWQALQERQLYDHDTEAVDALSALVRESMAALGGV